jgi:hypothetical protein
MANPVFSTDYIRTHVTRWLGEESKYQDAILARYSDSYSSLADSLVEGLPKRWENAVAARKQGSREGQHLADQYRLKMIADMRLVKACLALDDSSSIEEAAAISLSHTNDIVKSITDETLTTNVPQLTWLDEEGYEYIFTETGVDYLLCRSGELAIKGLQAHEHMSGDLYFPKPVLPAGTVELVSPKYEMMVPTELNRAIAALDLQSDVVVVA